MNSIDNYDNHFIITLNNNKLILSIQNQLYKITKKYPKSKIKEIDYVQLNQNKFPIILYTNGRIQFPNELIKENSLFIKTLNDQNSNIIEMLQLTENVIILFKKNGTKLVLNFANMKIFLEDVSFIEEGEQITRSIGKSVSQSTINLLTNKNNIYTIKIKEDGLSINKFSGIQSHVTSSDGKVAFINKNKTVSFNNSITKKSSEAITNEFSNKIESLVITNKFVLAKIGLNQYQASLLYNDLYNLGRIPNHTVTIDHVENVYKNNTYVMIQFTDGKLAMLNSKSELDFIEMNSKIIEIIPIPEVGFIIQNEFNELYLIKNNQADTFSVDRSKLNKMLPNETIVRYFPSTYELLIQYKNGQFDSLIQRNRHFQDSSDQVSKLSQYYLKDFDKLNIDITNAILEEKAR